MTFETWAALVAAVFVLAALPGPSALLLAAQARALGLRAAMAALAGDLLACVLLVTLVGAGMGAALAAAPGLMQAVRAAGFAWLAWLLWRALRPRAAGADRPARRAPPLALFAQGFVTCVANPKLALHLAAFLPLFIDPARPLAPQLALAAATHAVVDGATLGVWAWAGARLGRGAAA